MSQSFLQSSKIEISKSGNCPGLTFILVSTSVNIFAGVLFSIKKGRDDFFGEIDLALKFASVAPKDMQVTEPNVNALEVSVKRNNYTSLMSAPALCE